MGVIALLFMLCIAIALTMSLAPTPTVRTLPTGTKPPEGFPVLVTFSLNPGLWFWEKVVKPPNYDNGEPIDQTTQFNIKWMTKAPRALIDMGPLTMKGTYDPDIYTQIQSMMGVKQTITHKFPNGSTLAFYGFVMKFEPDDVEIGKQPEATITYCPTNWDPANQVEAGPAYASAHGT